MSEETETQEVSPQYYMDEVYKQWHTRGFLSVKYWPHAEKVQIEIGSIDPNTSKQTSFSKCFIDVYKFLAYLHAEVNNQVHFIFPEFATKDWQVFGGKAGGEAPISRVFTAGYWKASKDSPADPTRRSFRCANYVGKPTKNGAVMPDYTKVISFNFIQMKFFEIAELYQRLSIAVNAYAIQRTDQVDIYSFDGADG